LLKNNAFMKNGRIFKQQINLIILIKVVRAVVTGRCALAHTRAVADRVIRIIPELRACPGRGGVGKKDGWGNGCNRCYGNWYRRNRRRTNLGVGLN